MTVNQRMRNDSKTMRRHLLNGLDQSDSYSKGVALDI